MTIKKRLFWSNLMMILVPVLISALIALCCLGGVWYAVAHGSGLGFEDSEDFFQATSVISEGVEKAVLSGEEENLNALSSLMDRSAMSVLVYTDGVESYAYGEAAAEDEALCSAAAALQNEGIISSGDRSMYAHTITDKTHTYLIYLFSTRSNLSHGTLKVALAMVTLVLLFTVLCSVLFTNRFLTKFVLQKIEQPLDILTNGVTQIRDGNLDYRLEYAGQDEFTPVCAAFNEMAQRLKFSVEKTQKQENSRKELLAGISHDLRSPLTSIQAYVEGLLDGVAKTPETQQKYLYTIKTKAEDIQRMVAQLFLFSKMDMDEYPTHPERMRLDELTAQLVEETAAQYEEKGLSIATQLCPAEVNADPAELRRVLTNVLDNSVKYKNKPHASMSITLCREEKAWRLTLTDDGPGVPPEALPRLFDVFYRSDPARQNPDRGSGLGLAIAAKAMARMGGSIAAENVAGGGLSVLLRLPVEEPENE
ncbi:MAG: HAMP domain-containing sensor histidine kinase [Pygmaiobacter sp.]|nr:HAMP domain-containing sensor histidine kinase [Pygmaiobacter sp.]